MNFYGIEVERKSQKFRGEKNLYSLSSKKRRSLSFTLHNQGVEESKGGKKMASKLGGLEGQPFVQFKIKGS